MTTHLDTDAYAPREVASRVRAIDVTKARLDLVTMFSLAVLAGAFVAAKVAFTSTHLQELLKDLFERVGVLYSTREDLTISEHMQEQVKQVIDRPPSTFAGMEVTQVNKLDGCKWILPDGSWYLIRPSGTEPIIRCYREATTPARLEEIMQAGREVLQIPKN